MKSEKLKDKTTAWRLVAWKRKLLLLCTLHFTLFTSYPAVFAHEESAENRLEIFLNGLETFSAGFEQRLFNEYHAQLDYSTGRVFLKQPGRFHWEYTEPYSQFLISDGETMWIYDADLEQVTISNIAGMIEETPAAVLTGNVDIDEKFLVIELGSTDSIDWIELTPRNIESQFDSLRLGFRDQELAAMVLLDNLGQITEITFTGPVRNPDLNDSLFRLVVPENVDVIDSREGPGTED